MVDGHSKCLPNLMDLKDTITKWHSSMCLLEENKLNEAAVMLHSIKSPPAKIFHNLGCIRMLQNMYSEAAQFFTQSIEQDKFLALSYCQRGICYLKTRRYDLARSDFEKAQSLTPDTGINYNQLGADKTLLPSDISEYLNHARSSFVRQAPLHIEVRSTMSCVFQPPKKMVENLVKQNFLGKAKVVSSTEERDIEYASSKTVQQTKVGAKISKASSVPSSPVPNLRRVVLSSNGTQVIVPPRPQRPAPILQSSQVCQSQGGTNFKLMREKSRSAEDILESGDRSHKSIVPSSNIMNSAQKRTTSGYCLAVSSFPANQEEKIMAVANRNRVLFPNVKPAQDQEISKRAPPRRSQPTGIVRELAGVFASSTGKSTVHSTSSQSKQSNNIGNPTVIQKPPKPPRPPPPNVAKGTD